MTRTLCLALVAGCLVATPGCSSCFGNSCRRPSFMEFRRDRGCGCEVDPCHAPPCGCEPCGSPAPCCEGGVVGGTVISPGPAPATAEPGTFS
jgi:hypothetical protein